MQNRAVQFQTHSSERSSSLAIKEVDHGKNFDHKYIAEDNKEIKWNGASLLEEDFKCYSDFLGDGDDNSDGDGDGNNEGDGDGDGNSNGDGDSNDSVDESNNEGILLRRQQIWKRRNIIEIEHEVAKRKIREKMSVPHAVVEKIKKNEFELSNLIDEAKHFIEGKYLVFYQNDFEQARISENIYQNSESKVKDAVKKINDKFVEIDDKWKTTCAKEDTLLKFQDIITLRDQGLDLLKQKDDIIDGLMADLDELSYKFISEEESNSSTLTKLNEIANNKIDIVKEEHKKYHYDMTELIEEEKLKRIKKDSIEWDDFYEKLMMNISSADRLSLILKNNTELKKLYVVHENDIQNHRIDYAKKNIGIDADLELLKIKCATNIENLNCDCSYLKKTELVDNNIISNQRRRIVILQQLQSDIKEKLKKMAAEHEIQIPIIKKQIIKINARIDEKEQMADMIVKKNNCQYTEIWKLQQNDFIGYINEILDMDDRIRTFLGICELARPVMKVLPACAQFIDRRRRPGVVDLPHDNATAISYRHARDRDLNKLLLDFVRKNSNFLFDYDSNEILDSNASVAQDLPYAYNALRMLKLNNEDAWDLMKSMFKPFVVCVVCKTRVDWENDGTAVSNAVEREKCTANPVTDNNCTEELKTEKSVLDILATHITRHNEYVDKVNKLDSHVCELNDVNSDKNIFLNANEEEKTITYSTTKIVNADTPAKSKDQCGNVNHELSIDNKHFMPTLTKIIKKNRSLHQIIPKSLGERLAKEYDYLQWKLTEDDLRKYWSQFIEFIPNTVDSWDIYYEAIRRYHSTLHVRKNKLPKIKQLQNENKELINIIGSLECNQ